MTICHKLDDIPDLLAVHARKPDTYPYLLASNTRGNQNSRYSILMAHPQEIATQLGIEDDCLQAIDIDPCQQQADSRMPFVGGWFVFLAYEYAQTIEPRVNYFSDDSGMPVAFRSRVPAAIVVDHEDDSAWIIVEDEFSDLQSSIEFDLNQTDPIKRNILQPPVSMKKTRRYTWITLPEPSSIFVTVTFSRRTCHVNGPSILTIIAIRSRCFTTLVVATPLSLHHW